ncbi:MAG TPA: PKD domain-containing protein [Trueperaceae bacterium]|nr:PKD domain-containing protein [Trueperaceae bacterium]
MLRRLLLLPLLSLLVGMVLVGCGTSAPPGPAESPVIIPKTTKILDAATRASLLSYDPSSGELRFGPQATFGALEPDDVLVTEPVPPIAPYGFLRKVVSVQAVGSDTVVETVPAKLAEAIHQGNFKIHQQLTPSMLASATILAQGVSLQSDSLSTQFTVPMNNVVLFDADGNHATTGDQITASGSFTLKPILDIDGGLHFQFCCSVQSRFKFEVGLQQSVHVSVSAGKSAQVKKDIPLLDMTFDYIDVQIGPFPLVFVPKLQVFADLTGNVSAELTFTAAENLTLTAGTDKPYGQGFHDISKAEFGGSSDASGLHFVYPGVSMDMKPEIGARFQFLLYDLVGPQATLSAYVRFLATIPGDPPWTLYAGLTGKLGLHVSVLDYNWDKTIFDVSKVVAQASGNNAPELTPSDVEPADGSSVQLGVPVQFSVLGRDVEDGGIYSGTWTSDVDGAITLDANRQHTFTTAGLRHITVTVKDSSGATASTTIGVTVLDTPPVATLSSPFGGATVYLGYPMHVLYGSAVDANEPGGVLECQRVTWATTDASASIPPDICVPSGDPPVQVATFNTSGTFSVTLTATDPQNKSDVKQGTITVVSKPANMAPSVTIESPKQQASVGDSQALELKAFIEDFDSSALVYAWHLYPGIYIGAGAPGPVIASGLVHEQTDGQGHLVGEETDDMYTQGIGCSGTNDPYTLSLAATDGTNTTVVRETISCTFIPR